MVGYLLKIALSCGLLSAARASAPSCGRGTARRYLKQLIVDGVGGLLIACSTPLTVSMSTFWATSQSRPIDAPAMVGFRQVNQPTCPPDSMNPPSTQAITTTPTITGIDFPRVGNPVNEPGRSPASPGSATGAI
jgi:hypothetical protein